MSERSKRERANIISQCSDRLLVLSGIASSTAMSSITPIFPCGFEALDDLRVVLLASA